MSNWQRDPRTEQDLEELGIQWEYKIIPFKDAAPDLTNRARLAARLDQEVVLDYALHMIDGAAFPAVVLYNAPKPPYRAASGNHRLAAAAEAGWDEVGAYMVAPQNSRMRVKLELQLNLKHGLRVDTTDRVRLAIHLMEQENLTHKEAAAEVEVRESTLREVIRRDTTVERIHNLGFGSAVIGELGGSTILRLIGQVDSDPALAALVSHQSEKALRMTREELGPLIAEVKKHRDDASKVAFIDARYKAAADRGGAPIGSPGTGRGRDKIRPVVDAAKPSRVRKQLLAGLSKMRTLVFQHRTRSKAGLLQHGDYLVALQSAQSIYEAIKDMPE